MADSGCPHSVCVRSRKASSSAPTEAHDSPGCILYRWQEHLDGSPRVPKTARRSSQLTSLAGTTVIGSVAVSVMPKTVLQTFGAERRRASGPAGRRSVGLGGSRRAPSLRGFQREAVPGTTLAGSGAPMGFAFVTVGCD